MWPLGSLSLQDFVATILVLDIVRLRFELNEGFLGLGQWLHIGVWLLKLLASSRVYQRDEALKKNLNVFQTFSISRQTNRHQCALKILTVSSDFVPLSLLTDFWLHNVLKLQISWLSFYKKEHGK